MLPACLQVREGTAVRVGVALGLLHALRQVRVHRDPRQLRERERGRLDHRVRVWLAVVQVERLVPVRGLGRRSAALGGPLEGWRVASKGLWPLPRRRGSALAHGCGGRGRVVLPLPRAAAVSTRLRLRGEDLLDLLVLGLVRVRVRARARARARVRARVRVSSASSACCSLASRRISSASERGIAPPRPAALSSFSYRRRISSASAWLGLGLGLA